MAATAQKSRRRRDVETVAQDDDDPKRGAFDEPTIDDFLLNNHSDVPIVKDLPSMEWLKKHFKTKSAICRYLRLVRNIDIKDIHKHTGWRYQMIRNVTTKYLKRGANEDWHLPEGVVDPTLPVGGPPVAGE